MQKRKKVIYKNKSLVGTVALIVAVLALFLGLMYGVSKTREVEAKEPDKKDSVYEEVLLMMDALKAKLGDADKKNEQLTKEMGLQYQHFEELSKTNYNKLIKESDGKYTEITKEITKEKEAKDQKIQELETQLKEVKETIRILSDKVGNVDTYYPIGSLYLSLSDKSPADLFGGKWELVASGKNLMGAGNAAYPLGSDGGSYELVLAQNNLPNYDLIVSDPGHVHEITDPGHSHGITDPGHGHSGGSTGYEHSNVVPQAGAMDFTDIWAGGSSGIGHSTTGISVNAATTGITVKESKTGIAVNSGGRGDAISLLSPYLVVNIWKRIA